MAERPPLTALATTFAAALPLPLTAAHIVDAALQHGVSALQLAYGLRGELLEHLSLELQARRSGSSLGELQVLAVDALLGAERLGRPRAARASLASRERDEAAAAVEVCEAALALASEVRAPFILLTLGPVQGLGDRWDEVRRGFLRGALAEDDAPAEEMMALRNALAGRHLDAALRSLDRVAELSRRAGVTALLRSPRRAVELPTALELGALLSALRGAPLSSALDLPAAHLASTMRLLPLRETVLAFGAGPLASLGDACGAVGALPPGRGEVEVAAVARSLPGTAHRLFSPWPGLRLDEAVEGYRAVAALPRAPS